MKWCVDFPEESVLVARPSLNALCLNCKPAAKLLSVLLYRYSIRQEHQGDAQNINEVDAAQGKEPAQDVSFYIYRKQSQLVADMIDEITEKTLHDVAIPTLQLLGYLDVDESPIIHKYDLHVDIVRGAMEAYKKSPKHLQAFILRHVQLEKFLIDLQGLQLEEVLIDKKFFQFALEKILIANRNSSNNKRGRKTRQERPSRVYFKPPKISREIDSKIGNEEGDTGASAPPARASSPAELLSESAKLKAIVNAGITRLDGDETELEETVKRPAVRVPSPETVRGAEPPVQSGGATHPQSSTGGDAPPRSFAGASESCAPGVGDGPPPTLTRKQQDKLIEKTFAAYWQVIEAWKGQRYSQAQRGQACHTSGLESMFADGVTPDMLKAKLKLLDDFQRRTFTAKKLYLEWWNNLDEQAAPPTKNKTKQAKPLNNGYSLDMTDEDYARLGVSV